MLARRRHDLHLTQAQVAERAGVSRPLLIDLERGKRPGIEIGRVFAVLRALDLAISAVPVQDASFDDQLADLLGDESQT